MGETRRGSGQQASSAKASSEHIHAPIKSSTEQIYAPGEEKKAEGIQKNAFSRWINQHLKSKGFIGVSVNPPTFAEDLSSGEALIQLLEALGGVSLGKFNKNPRMRIQRVENVNTALAFIKKKGIMLTNIGAEDVVDENLKLALGLIWSLILKFDISEISEEGLSAKEGLLLWCQRRTVPYQSDFFIKDFHMSWTDGLALCGLIHRHRPDLIDYWSLDKSQKRENTRLGIDVAEQHFGIPRLLEVEDLVDMVKPDERSVVTYISQFYHYFSQFDKLGAAGRRIGQLGAILLGSWEMQNDYEARVQKLLKNISEKLFEWKNLSPTLYNESRQLLADLEKFKSSVKREWIVEKRELDTLLSNIQTKLKTYHLAPYTPPAGLQPSVLEHSWDELVDAESKHKQDLSTLIRQIRDGIRKDFANAANALSTDMKRISLALANIGGENELEEQLKIVNGLVHSLQELKPALADTERKSAACVEANIVENQFTVHSYEDLSFEHYLLSSSLTKKIVFIENQIVARSVTNITAELLNEITETFNHFQQDNVLNKDAFRGAIQALGIATDESSFEKTYAGLSANGLPINFESFTNYVKSNMEDRLNAVDIIAAFKALSVDNKNIITANDLAKAGIPKDVAEYYLRNIPQGDYAAFVKGKFV